MKSLRHLIFALLLLCPTIAAAQKEVLVVGVLHTLPEVVMRSYGALLRVATDYKPQAIYVECVPPTDEQSWDLITEREGEMAEFWQMHLTMRDVSSNLHLKFDPTNLGKAIGYFQYFGDYANAAYYYYKLRGAPKQPLGNEFDDLAFPLAATLGIDSLRSFDSRTLNAQYQSAIHRAIEESNSNDNGKAYAKLFNKDYNASVAPAMFGTYGRHINTDAALRRADRISSFDFAPIKTAAVQDVGQWWRKRNEVLADNIGSQIEQSDATRSVVFVGCAHVMGICRALREKFPTLDVKTIDQIEK